jgi:hypothetical protein
MIFSYYYIFGDIISVLLFGILSAYNNCKLILLFIYYFIFTDGFKILFYVLFFLIFYILLYYCLILFNFFIF